jgi:hypothetical protein
VNNYGLIVQVIYAQTLNDIIFKFNIVHAILWDFGGGPRSLDSLMGGISSESVFVFLNFIGKHQAASANG